MRHGNKSNGVTNDEAHALRSYLWGMETMQNINQVTQNAMNSDPTYEAWKLNSPVLLLRSQITTPILPMRHGNYYFFLGVVVWRRTPILPMRHGNCFWTKSSSFWEISLRSYLWGMETLARILPAISGSELRSYLWGMETHVSNGSMT